MAKIPLLKGFVSFHVLKESPGQNVSASRVGTKALRPSQSLYPKVQFLLIAKHIFKDSSCIHQFTTMWARQRLSDQLCFALPLHYLAATCSEVIIT
jgi:hypothetical protein